MTEPSIVSAAPAASFDRIAGDYDALWSGSAIGRRQRDAVWRRVDPLFERGGRILDIGCGTGIDAAHFMARGVDVYGIDVSAEMVRMARMRGVDASVLPIEAIGELSGRFDGALSNFGALNCVQDLQPVARAMARLIRPRGWLAICLMGCCCAWEILHYVRRFQPGKAFRRWHPKGARSSLGMRVYYPLVGRLMSLFGRDFRLAGWQGIGLCVPPSFVGGLSDDTVSRLAALDRHVAHLPLLRGLADHRLLVFQRL